MIIKWFKDRTSEPSTYTALAVFLAALGLWLNSTTMDIHPATEPLLMAATISALLGLIGKDKDGPLL